MFEAHTTLMVDTDVSKFCVQNKIVRELHLYVVLRYFLKDRSGYISRKDAANMYASEFGCSSATAYRRIDSLIGLGWISERGSMIHVNGILRVKALLSLLDGDFHYSRYMTEATIRVNGNYRRVIDAFSVSVLEGIKLEKIQRNLHRSRAKASNAYQKDKVRHASPGKCKISKRLVEQRYDRSYAMSLVSADLGISISSVSRAKKKAQEYGFSNYERRFVEGVNIGSYGEVTKMVVLGQQWNPGRFTKVAGRFLAKDADRIIFGFSFGKRKGANDSKKSCLSLNVFNERTHMVCSTMNYNKNLFFGPISDEISSISNSFSFDKGKYMKSYYC